MAMESLRTQIKELEADIDVLEEKIQAKKTKKTTVAAQVQARIFLERIFYPYMTGVCQEWGVSPEEALQILIKEKATFGKIAHDNPKDLAELMSQPEIQLLLDIASPLEDVSDDWIKEKTDILFEVMADIRPELARVIADTPEGTEWFYDSLTGLRKILFGKPQLNIER